VLDELLWRLFGWIWVAGGRPLAAWTHELAWQCEDCCAWQGPDEGCADDYPEICDDCWNDLHPPEWCDVCGVLLTADQWLVGLDEQLCEACYQAEQGAAPDRDELLWALFGWVWLAGGRSELETWTPDETRIAGVDDDELLELISSGAVRCEVLRPA
jgi:hypothetical protein